MLQFLPMLAGKAGGALAGAAGGVAKKGLLEKIGARAAHNAGEKGAQGGGGKHSKLGEAYSMGPDMSRPQGTGEMVSLLQALGRSQQGPAPGTALQGMDPFLAKLLGG